MSRTVLPLVVQEGILRPRRFEGPPIRPLRRIRASYGQFGGQRSTVASRADADFPAVTCAGALHPSRAGAVDWPWQLSPCRRWQVIAVAALRPTRLAWAISTV